MNETEMTYYSRAVRNLYIKQKLLITAQVFAGNEMRSIISFSALLFSLSVSREKVRFDGSLTDIISRGYWHDFHKH